MTLDPEHNTTVVYDNDDELLAVPETPENSKKTESQVKTLTYESTKGKETKKRGTLSTTRYVIRQTQMVQVYEMQQ